MMLCGIYYTKLIKCMGLGAISGTILGYCLSSMLVIYGINRRNLKLLLSFAAGSFGSLYGLIVYKMPLLFMK